MTVDQALAAADRIESVGQPLQPVRWPHDGHHAALQQRCRVLTVLSAVLHALPSVVPLHPHPPLTDQLYALITQL